MFTARVATKGQRAFARHDIPEESTGIVVCLVASQFGYALKAYHLRHLRVGVHVVQTVATLRQRGQQPAVRETLGCVEVLSLTRHRVSIGQHLVHAAMLGVEGMFHLCVRELCRQVDGPVAEA